MASKMEANRGMVAGSRGGVVTIRHDGDGAAVRSFAPALPCSPRALTPLCPVAFRFARGGPSICRAAVRCRADCVGSASDWRPVRSLCGMPRFCCVGVGGFRCGALVEWRVDWFHCSPRHLFATVVLRNAEGIWLRWIVQLVWVYRLNFVGTVRILQSVDTNNLFTC